ncbi:MAG: hypothetical protein Q8O15_07575 [Rectinemataceae bacterium]|nr:hypothetical protein [Rectinemataceae bacterium]
MKKRTSFAAFFCLMCVFAFAEVPAASADPHANEGDLIVNAGVLYGWYGFGLGGGAEYIFARWNVTEHLPLTFGAAAKASFGYPGLAMDLAAMATMHFDFESFPALPRFLRNFDWYWGLGLGACLGSSFGFGPMGASGTSYFINPNLAINADIYVPFYIGLGVGYTGLLGVKWKL